MTPEPDVTLKEHLERVIQGELKAIEARLDGMDKALDVASADMDRRLEQMNQFRDQLNVERGNFITREYYEKAHETLMNSVHELERRSLTRDVFDAVIAEWSRWRQSIERRGSEATGRTAGITVSARAVSGTIAAVAALVVIIFTVLAANGRL